MSDAPSPHAPVPTAPEDQPAEDVSELEPFFTLSLDLLCIAGTDGYFKRLNPAWESVLGYEEGELVERPFIEFVHPKDRDATIVEAAKLAQGGHQTVGFQNRYRHRDGSYRWLVWTTSEHDGHLYAVARDITDQKDMEIELLRAKDEAERANRSKSEFLSRMSHELRTPLNAVLGYAQLIELQYEDPKIREATHSIIAGGQHLLTMINEILELARIEGGTLSISLEPVPVMSVLGQALELVRPMAESAGIPIRIDETICEELHVRGDQQRLVQVVVNLLSNAVKYNRVGGSVEVRCASTDDLVGRIEVSDTGGGISEKDQAMLFQPFERFGDPGIEGTGLGLALSKRFVSLMGGTLELIESSPAGSTFAIELATTAGVQARSSSVAKEAVEANLGSRCGTVLYIEDNLSNLRLIESFFATCPNLKLLPSMQGGLGIEMAQQHLPDLILLDVHLPDMPGDQVLERLKSNGATREIPVVVLSADATPRQIEALQRRGAVTYLTKPLNLKELAAVMEGHLPFCD